jgi:hypothetical protein
VGTGGPGPTTSRLTENLSEVMHGTSGTHPDWREDVT